MAIRKVDVSTFSTLPSLKMKEMKQTTLRDIYQLLSNKLRSKTKTKHDLLITHNNIITIIAFNSDCLIALLWSVVLAGVIALVLVLRRSIENCFTSIESK